MLKNTLFLKVSKIREVIYVTEGVWPITDYKEWRNSPCKAGYADSIVQNDERLLLTLSEFELAGRYFLETSFSESSREEISIDKAMSRVSMNYRVAMELVPKTAFTGVAKGATKRPPPGVAKYPNRPTKKPKEKEKGAKADSPKAEYLI